MKMNKKSKYNVAVVGVGVVGIEMLRCLKQRAFPINELRIFARSAREISVDNHIYKVGAVSPEGFQNIDIVFFAGTEGEKGAAVTFAPEAVRCGAVVIDNGADFRLKKTVPLVVPEVNPKDVARHKGIIANPNCSTIQMVVAIWPIKKSVGLKRIIVSSYQAVSGAGRSGVIQLENELKGREVAGGAFAYLIANNIIPQIGDFGRADYTSEEWKMVHETHKILHDESIKISATCARVPVITGHCEAIYLETKKGISVENIRKLLSKNPGIKVIDEPKKGLYPLPIVAEGKDEVFVGRIRKDPFQKNGFWLWVVSDNLRKGAALNAIQIAELLIKRKA
ncbi:MAG: aspartate-semialdehyde dehydrogenase [Candidatus Omnitrophica bacterium]|nr:aspartate-semialdehyde dehydrogenase [Candidatus Omnitrophota bacterium]